MKRFKKIILPLVCMSLFAILICSKKIMLFRDYFIENNLLADSSKSIRYYKSSVILDIVSTVWGIAVPLIIIFSGLSTKIKELSYSVCKKSALANILYVLLFALVYYILYFPLDFYSGFINKHIFLLSNQSFGRWFYDWLIDLITTAAGLGLIVWIPYMLIKKYRKRWWLYTWLISIPLVFMISIVAPVFIDPLYNKFSPLKDKDLKSRIEVLENKANISGCSIYVVDKSKDTDAVNAYMTGIGSTKRIVIWDTAIKNLSKNELMFIVAHEMGHYVLKHVLIGTILTMLGILAVLLIIDKSASFFVRRYGRKFRCSSISDISSLPLIVLIITICLFISEPFSNAWSRKIEKDADTFAIELTRDNKSGVDAFENLSRNNLSIKQPDEWYKIWKYDHPTLQERIDFIRSYKPWENNKPLKYEKYFKK